MSEQENENIIHSKNLIEFVTIAIEFCYFVENIRDYDKTEFIDKSIKLLPLLYLKAALLPEVEIHSHDLVEKFVTEEEWETISNDVSFLMGENNIYNEIYEPLEKENDIVNSSISENFADIYQDVKDFICLYNIGTEDIIIDAIRECNSTFKQYWGQRLVNLLRILHTLYCNNTN
ncbi:MAG: DUF5063 domain-containing protein [Bacteroidales bacterium]|nr:DUF5063 domain-containing protein [Bacteroidales bacterium]